MVHTIDLDGHVWTRHADRMCLACGGRTYRMHRRTATELIWDRYPGPQGTHTFTRGMGGPTGGVFAICTRCFVGRFGRDRPAVLKWDRETRALNVPKTTSE